MYSHPNSILIDVCINVQNITPASPAGVTEVYAAKRATKACRQSGSGVLGFPFKCIDSCLNYCTPQAAQLLNPEQVLEVTYDLAGSKLLVNVTFEFEANHV